MKKRIKKILPKKVHSLLSKLYRKIIIPNNESKILDKSWYDEAYRETNAYHIHYTESHYYFLWSVLLDRIRRLDVNAIIDLGCGSGQFASLLSDNKINNYLGIDFSSEAIKLAESTCPSYNFKCLDLTKSDILLNHNYDCVITLEFLEHVEFDIDVLGKIKSGTKVFATVPNFPYISHVRHFNNKTEVINRYKHLFSDFTVDTFLKNSKGKTFFLIEGTKL